MPLHSPVNGAQTAVVCLSVRLVQQKPSLGAQDPAPLTSRSLKHSQVLFCTEYAVLIPHVLLATAGPSLPLHGHAATPDNMTQPRLLFMLCAAQEGAQSVDSHGSWGCTSPPFQQRTEPHCASSPSIRSAGEAFWQTCHEGNFAAAWAQLSRHTHHSSGQAIDIKALREHGTLLALHREDGSSSSSYKPRMGGALKCCCCPCAQHGDCHNPTTGSCASDVEFERRQLCSMRQPSREALPKETHPAQEDAIPEKRQPERSVTVSRAMLEATLQGLAKGLTEIDKLRQEALKLQTSSKPPDSPVPTIVQQEDPAREGLSKGMLEATLESLTRGLAEIDKLRQDVVKLHVSSGSPDCHLCTPLQQRASPPVAMQQSGHTTEHPGQSEGKQPSDLHPPPPRLQHAHVFRLGQASRRASKKQSSETSKAGREEKAGTYAYAQPKGHPVFNWRASLRAEKPPMGSGTPQRARKGAQQDMSTSGVRTPARKEHSRAKASANKLSPALSPAAEQPPPQERENHDGGPQHRDKAGHEHMRQQQEKMQQQQQQQQGKKDPLPASTPFADAQAKGGQGDIEQATSTSAPLSCKHLKGRYLPLYSVFDEDGVLAEDALAVEFWEQCHTLPMAHHVLGDADGARQDVQVDHNEYMHAEDERRTDSLHRNATSPEVPVEARELQIQEDALRAAMQSFAMRVSE